MPTPVIPVGILQQHPCLDADKLPVHDLALDLAKVVVFEYQVQIATLLLVTIRQTSSKSNQHIAGICHTE